MKIAALKPMAQVFFIKCRHFRFSHLLRPNFVIGRQIRCITPAPAP